MAITTIFQRSLVSPVDIPYGDSACVKIKCTNFTTFDGSPLRLTLDFGVATRVYSIVVGTLPADGVGFDPDTILYQSFDPLNGGIVEIETNGPSIDNNGYLLIQVDGWRSSNPDQRLKYDSVSSLPGCSIAQKTWDHHAWTTHNFDGVGKVAFLTKVEQGLPIQGTLSTQQPTVSFSNEDDSDIQRYFGSPVQIQEFNSGWCGNASKVELTNRNVPYNNFVSWTATGFRFAINPSSYRAHNRLGHPIRLHFQSPTDATGIGMTISDVYIAKATAPYLTNCIPGTQRQLTFDGGQLTKVMSEQYVEFTTDYLEDFQFDYDEWVVVLGRFTGSGRPLTATTGSLTGVANVIFGPYGGFFPNTSDSGNGSTYNAIPSILEISRIVDREGSGTATQEVQATITHTPDPVVLGNSAISTSIIQDTPTIVNTAPKPVVLGVQSFGGITPTQVPQTFGYELIFNANVINKGAVTLTQAPAQITHTPDPITPTWIWYAEGVIQQYPQDFVCTNAKVSSISNLADTPVNVSGWEYIDTTDCVYLQTTDCSYQAHLMGLARDWDYNNTFDSVHTVTADSVYYEGLGYTLGDWVWESTLDSIWTPIFTQRAPAPTVGDVSFNYNKGSALTQVFQGPATPAYNDIPLPTWGNVGAVSLVQEFNTFAGIQDLGVVKTTFSQTQQTFSVEKNIVIEWSSDITYLNTTVDATWKFTTVTKNATDWYHTPTLDSIYVATLDNPTFSSLDRLDSQVFTSVLDSEWYSSSTATDPEITYLNTADTSYTTSLLGDGTYSWDNQLLQPVSIVDSYALTWKGLQNVYSFEFEGGVWEPSTENWGNREVRIVLGPDVLRADCTLFKLWFNTDQIQEAYIGLGAGGASIGPFEPTPITFNAGATSPAPGTFTSDRITVPFDLNPATDELVVHIVTKDVALQAPHASGRILASTRVYWSEVTPGTGSEVWQQVPNSDYRFLVSITSADDISSVIADSIQPQPILKTTGFVRYQIPEITLTQNQILSGSGFSKVTALGVALTQLQQEFTAINDSVWSYPTTILQPQQEFTAVDDWIGTKHTSIKQPYQTAQGVFGLNGGYILVYPPTVPIIQRQSGVADVPISGVVSVPTQVTPGTLPVGISMGTVDNILMDTIDSSRVSSYYGFIPISPWKYVQTDCLQKSTFDCTVFDVVGFDTITVDYTFTNTQDSYWESTQLHTFAKPDVTVYEYEVEGRLVDSVTEVPITQWTHIGWFSGNFDGTLFSVPEGGWYKVQARLANSRVFTSSGEVGVGDLIIAAGQSNIDRWVRQVEGFTQQHTLNPLGKIYNGSYLYNKFPEFNEFSGWGDPEDTVKDEDSCITFLNQVVQQTGVPTGFIHVAVGGTPLLTKNDKQGWYDGDLYPYMMSQLQDLGGKFSGMLWNQGESDVGEGVSRSQYETALSTFFNNVRTDLIQPDLPIIVAPIGRTTYLPWTDFDWYSIQRGTLGAISSSAYTFSSGSNYDAPMMDVVHYNEVGREQMATRMAQTYLYATGYTPVSGPPSILSYKVVSNTTLELKLSTDQVHLNAGTAHNGFELLSPTGSVTIIDINRVGDTITIIHAQSDLTEIRYCYGKDPFGVSLDTAVPGILVTNGLAEYPLDIYKVYAGTSESTLLMGLNF